MPEDFLVVAILNSTTISCKLFLGRPMSVQKQNDNG